jgi:two-component system, cell cycle sensor histidine kinase and response regulator CckA
LEQTECFRLAVEFAPSAIVMVDHEGKIVLVNAQAEKLFDYEREHLLGRFVELLVPESLRTNHESLREGFLLGPAMRPMGAGRELVGQRRDGHRFPVEIGLTPVETGAGTWVVCSLVDITERRLAEAKLRESEELFRKIADATPAMIWVSGPDKLCTFFNRGWLTFTGSTMEQALGNGWSGKVHPDDRERCYTGYTSAFDARHTYQTECRLRRADGEYRWVLATGAPRWESNGVFEGYVGSCVDVTDLKHAQEQAVAGQKLESMGQLAAGIAHDFNNLLGGILVSAEISLQEQEEKGVALDENLLTIKAAALGGAAIVRQLMVYGGEKSEGFELVDFSSLISEMRGLLQVSISKNAILRTELDADHPVLNADASQIRQLVMNLVTNASEAIGNRAGVIRISTARTRTGPNTPATSGASLREGDYVKLEVSDTGVGMTAEVRTRIFDPFFSTKFAGRGLGMAAVQGIVRAHNGAITVESSLGTGTRIEILFPCTNEPAPEFHRVVKAGSAAIPETVTGNVLIVEDEEALRLAVSRMLRMKGLSVIEAVDGRAAIDLFRSSRPEVDAVLLDMALPGMSGPEVFAELRRIRPNVRVILTTAYSQDMALTAFGGKRTWGFLRKPYLLDDLWTLVRDACQPEP